MGNKNLIILFVSITIAMLGYGMTFTVLPFYIESMGGGGFQFGILMALFGLMQLVFAPVWGKVSDKYGRKTILVIGMIGLSSAMFLFGLAQELWMLYIAQIASGILSSAVFPVSMAYISDSSEDVSRSGHMGKVGAAAGVGVIIGPGIGGILSGNSISTPFFVGSGLCLVTCLIVFLFLPESLPREKRLSSIEKIKLIEIKGMWDALSSPIAFALFIAFAVNFGKSNFTGAYAFYVTERFKYGPKEVGSILMVSGLLYTIAQGILVGPLTKKLGEGRVIKLSLLGSCLGYILMLLAFNYTSMLLTVGFFNLFNALLKPTTLAVISQKATMAQGTAMGIAESYLSLGRVMGPLWAGYILDKNIYYPYLSGALFFMIMLLISLRVDSEKYLEHNI